MATNTISNRSDRSFFNTEALSDVKIKFSGQQLFCHKTVLARKSEYFYRAFTGQFPVASSSEIDLGDDDDPEAVRAMIRHIYDLPYDQMLEGNTSDDTAAYSTNEDLLFYIAVFTAADKYDVSTLRPLVVKKFEDLMETTWEGDQFATAIQKLTGPSAGHLADNTLQTAAATFCAKNLTKLIKKETFVKMIQDEEPFSGRLLTGFVTGISALPPVPFFRCQQSKCKELGERDPAFLSGVREYAKKHCMHCDWATNTPYYDDNGMYEHISLTPWTEFSGSQ
ncbi:hypothetical protein D6C92_02930 [Aureobasidium pullulans]|uniref:BTB domain-containing protein n=1 Tax=Aureobasidium pullulans TaxID=5580 RepID=A0A4S8SSH1_AURPU|nr:hypothetical protein D6D28_03000 [Aureobasidium pullulans]THY98312.1 hypothetical protein D6C92_02930 [Aureobasidium pullulans]